MIAAVHLHNRMGGSPLTQSSHTVPNTDPRQAIEAFHAWRRELLLPGHQVAGTEMPDPELVLSSKMLRVFSAMHPEYNRHTVQLQMHFLEKDYTNRVEPGAWREVLGAVKREPAAS